MHQNIAQIYGRKLGAIDGDIGHVKDLYFDEQTWKVRYLVVDTGTWIHGRVVLLSPHAFGSHPFGRTEADVTRLMVNLTRNQIQESPPMDSHRPVSRQYEEEYYRYYGYQAYWQDGSMWGIAGYPLATPLESVEPLHKGHNQRDDLHLRSMRAVTGYAIQGTDGTLGTVSSFILDSEEWRIHELVVEAGHWYAGKKILLLPENILRISYNESTVFVNLSMDDIKRTKRNRIVLAGAAE